MIQSKEIVVKELEDGAQSLQALGHSISIKSKEELEAAAGVLTDIKAYKFTITSRKEEITRPLMQALASARDLFRPFEDVCLKVEKQVKEKIGDYQASVEEEKGKPEEIPGIHQRTYTKVRVIDATKVPKKYMIPDLQAITEAVLRRGERIKGVEVYEETKVISR